jgi:hypothetical protein
VSGIDQEKVDGVSSLRDWLGRIASEESLSDLDPKFHALLRPPAQQLWSSGQSFSASALAGVEDSAQLSALSAAVHLRSLEAVEFWGPLLKQCLTGRSTAPLADLRRTATQAEALIAALTQRAPSPVRDEVLRLADEAATRTKKWLPQRGAGPKPSSVTPARYRRGTFEPEDEFGQPIPRPPAPEEEQVPAPESRRRRVVSWIVTLLSALGLLWGVWLYANQEPPSLPVTHYQAFLSETVGKTLDGEDLVLTVNEQWREKSEKVRGNELVRLLEQEGSAETYLKVRIVDTQGKVLARMERGGAPEWTEALNSERQGMESPLLEHDEAGILKKPLRAGEIPID